MHRAYGAFWFTKLIRRSERMTSSSWAKREKEDSFIILFFSRPSYLLLYAYITWYIHSSLSIDCIETAELVCYWHEWRPHTRTSTFILLFSIKHMIGWLSFVVLPTYLPTPSLHYGCIYVPACRRVFWYNNRQKLIFMHVNRVCRYVCMYVDEMRACISRHHPPHLHAYVPTYILCHLMMIVLIQPISTCSFYTRT